VSVPTIAQIKARCVVDSSGCWLWQGATVRGYGSLRYRYEHWYAHRAVLIRASGVVGEFACHHCDVRACCNPAHLYWGDAKTNATDCHTRGRAKMRGHTHHQSKLSPEAVHTIRLTPKTRGSGKRLAELYGVSQSVISEVRNLKAYTGDLDEVTLQ
jgi:hypothetical protein